VRAGKHSASSKEPKISRTSPFRQSEDHEKYSALVSGAAGHLPGFRADAELLAKRSEGGGGRAAYPRVFTAKRRSHQKRYSLLYSNVDPEIK